VKIKLIGLVSFAIIVLLIIVTYYYHGKIMKTKYGMCVLHY